MKAWLKEQWGWLLYAAIVGALWTIVTPFEGWVFWLTLLGFIVAMMALGRLTVWMLEARDQYRGVLAESRNAWAEHLVLMAVMQSGKPAKGQWIDDKTFIVTVFLDDVHVATQEYRYEG